MPRDTTKATQQFIKNKKIEREKRKEKLIEFIRMNPGETAYSISKNTGWPLKTVQNLLFELEDDLEIKIESEVENGRVKNKVMLRSAFDLTWTNFTEANLTDPIGMQLVKNSLRKHIPVSIHNDDGTTVIIETLEELELYI